MFKKNKKQSSLEQKLVIITKEEKTIRVDGVELRKDVVYCVEVPCIGTGISKTMFLSPRQMRELIKAIDTKWPAKVIQAGASLDQRNASGSINAIINREGLAALSN